MIRPKLNKKFGRKYGAVVDAKDNVKILQSEIQNLMLHRIEVLKELKAVSTT